MARGMCSVTHRRKRLRECEIGRELRARQAHNVPRALERGQFVLEDVTVVLNFARDAFPPRIDLLAVVS